MYSAPNSATAAAAPSSGEQSAAMSPSVTRQRTNSTFANCRSASDSASKAQRMPSIDDFDFVKPISRGAFGRVYLVRKKATKDLYAIKVMRKKDMINKNMVTQALAERRALSLLSTDWVVQLYYAFHSTKHLFLVMEYLIGGDLAGLLRVWGVMDEDAAKFYIGEVASAIDYLHRNSIVHRDIKPDNVILGSDGHIKLSDFGLSQVAVRGSGSGAEGKGAPDSADSPGTVDLNIASSSSSGAASENEVDKSDEYWTLELSKPGREAQAPASATNNPHAGKAPPPSKRAHARNKSSRGFLGTPDYLAPELLLGAGNGLAVDWWALGVCLFEFLCGYPPFTDESPEAIFRNILNHAIDWPDVEGYMSDEAASLIKALLQPNPSKRAHWKDIKTSSLFEDWDLSNIRDIEPPFVPMPDDDADTSYFEPCQRTEIQRLSNATFLQADSPRRAHPLLPSKLNDSQPSATISAKKDIGVLRGFPGVSGERRMSQPALFPPGASQPGGSPSIGQLKKLFSEMSAENLAKKSPASNDASPEPAASKEESIASADSSDKYSFKEDGREEGATGDDIEEVSTSEMAKTESSSTRNSLNSLSESDFEQIGEDDLEPTSPIIPPPPPVVASTYSTDAGIVLPPLPVGHSKFASLSRTPSQHSDGIQDGQPVSNVSSKSHSRCTSVQILMNGKKPNVIPPGGRSRRPSRGVDSSNLSEVDLKTSLQRANSVEDRHAHVSRPGSVVGSETGEIINSAGIDPGSASEEEMPDEETERAFDDFTYKNLALLSHVNKGVSSSGNSTPQTEKQGSASASASATPIPVAQQKRDNSSAPRTSSYSSVAGMVRNSPINAYDTKASPA
ncbi:hypothetical protein FBU59_001545 [Linderina macrospora]|uniref:Uncharacterized protein n=1 Tax=Linderina macrospora TaxID=4868 RepID=A0ACC1JE03_9FUNG|nr:hypothetical protein FBU59_001545 [Linderina macrospora]